MKNNWLTFKFFQYTEGWLWDTTSQKTVDIYHVSYWKLWTSEPKPSMLETFKHHLDAPYMVLLR